MHYKEYEKIELNDGRIGSIVDIIGNNYVVDVGTSEKDYETILVESEEIKRKIK